MQSSDKTQQGRTFLGHPYPLGSLFFTEMWERFSFYGIRPLLILFMAASVYEGGMSIPREQASAIVGIFAGSMYLAALPGGWLADNWLGQRRAVWYGSILIALGHLAIALSALWAIPYSSWVCFLSFWEPVYLKPVFRSWWAPFIKTATRAAMADSHCFIWGLTSVHSLRRW